MEGGGIGEREERCGGGEGGDGTEVDISRSIPIIPTAWPCWTWFCGMKICGVGQAVYQIFHYILEISTKSRTSGLPLI